MSFTAGDVLGAAALNAALVAKRVRVAIATNVTLASAVENGDTLDGVVLATGDRVGLLGQTSGAECGIYVVAASGAPTRAVDFDSSTEVLPNTLIVVAEGTANKDSVWQLTTNGSITVGTTALVFFPIHLQGTATPEGAVTAPIGALFRRTDGSTGTTLYIKESGTGNTGWVAVAASGAYVQIAQTVLGSPAASIDFTSIAATYRDLLVVISGSTSVAAVGDDVLVRFNNDSTASNYITQSIQASSTTIAGVRLTAVAGLDAFPLPGATDANAGGGGQILIPNYRGTTLYKAALMNGGYANQYDYANVGEWKNTAAITRVTLLPSTGPNFATGTVATLYGIGS